MGSSDLEPVLDAGRFDALADVVLTASAADRTEVVALGTDLSLTRFADSAIHQNVAERNVEIRVRALVGRRAGVATTNDLSEAALRRVTERAGEAARRQPEDPDLPDLPPSSHAPSVDAFRTSTAQCSAERRARLARVICRLANEAGLGASGACTTEARVVAVANSRGLRRFARSTRAGLLTVVLDDAASGYAEQNSQDVDDLDPEAVGHEAIDKALRSRNPIRVEPGEYTVVLEEYAVAEVLAYLGYMGFGALSLQEGTSFMRGRLGEQIVDGRISIWDDPSDPRGFPDAFDYEGVPGQRVALIQSGVAEGVVYDSRTAAREGRVSTGHALPAPAIFGPFPSHLVMAPGDTPRETLARTIERGLWVTRFHYVNVVKPDRAILTGLTRDGTFLIENGEVGRAVKNLRFTESILGAWNRLGALGSTVRLVDAWGGGILAPAMRIDGYSFTGVSDA
ncbi:MAG: TldD/PmbA family protein [Chloroflexi bacterium]|nr:TldD/PmbA family protein [Chloroflexota bacterium]